MVKIRLQRVGTKKQSKYRVVVTEEHSKRDGKVIEIVGRYDPMIEPRTVEIKKDRIDYWMSKGAMPTKAVSDLIKYYSKQGVSK